MIILIQYWVFFMPFYEVFISIFNCSVSSPDGSTNYHYLIDGLQCYTGMHILYCVLAAYGLFILLSLNTVIALLYNET
jgi:hypothetical protein